MTPLLLLDDVMSELDPGRRERLVARLGDGGQVLITAADEESVPAPPRERRGADATAADRKCRGMSRRRAPATGRRAPSRRRCSGPPRRPAWRPSRRPGRRRSASGWRRSRSPVSERDGTLTVECADAVWAQELDLMQETAAGAPARASSGSRPRKRLRFRVELRALLDTVFPRFAGNLTLGAGLSAGLELVFLWQLALRPDQPWSELQAVGVFCVNRKGLIA